MLRNKKGEASDKATPKTTEQRGAYQKRVRASKKIIAEWIGAVLWYLEVEANRQQRINGYDFLQRWVSQWYGRRSA